MQLHTKASSVHQSYFDFGRSWDLKRLSIPLGLSGQVLPHIAFKGIASLSGIQPFLSENAEKFGFWESLGIGLGTFALAKLSFHINRRAFGWSIGNDLTPAPRSTYMSREVLWPAIAIGLSAAGLGYFVSEWIPLVGAAIAFGDTMSNDID